MFLLHVFLVAVFRVFLAPVAMFVISVAICADFVTSISFLCLTYCNRCNLCNPHRQLSLNSLTLCNPRRSGQCLVCFVAGFAVRATHAGSVRFCGRFVAAKIISSLSDMRVVSYSKACV